MIRYREWVKERAYSYPKDSDFRKWFGSDWASLVSMFDMLKDMDINNIIIYYSSTKSSKIYSIEDIYRVSPKREHVKLRNQTEAILIV